MAGIYLYSGDVQRGYIYFFPDGTPLDPPVIDEENGAVYLHFNLSQFDAVLTLLREEQPVYLTARSPDDAWLDTDNEAIGEEEGIGG